MKKVLLLIFAVVSIVELLSTTFVHPMLHMICRPLIMVTLGMYYWVSSPAYRSTPMLMAILASLIGDVLLLISEQDQSLFLPGLGAFLIAQIFLVLTYRQHSNQADGGGVTTVQRIRMGFPVVLAGTGLIVVLFPVLGVLEIPVMIYAIVLMVMVLNAMSRLGRTNATSMTLVTIGAILFMTSDAILAVNKFLTPIDQASFWIMSTYIAAQFLIVRGVLAHN